MKPMLDFILVEPCDYEVIKTQGTLFMQFKAQTHLNWSVSMYKLFGCWYVLTRVSKNSSTKIDGHGFYNFKKAYSLYTEISKEIADQIKHIYS